MDILTVLTITYRDQQAIKLGDHTQPSVEFGALAAVLASQCSLDRL
jgi:hypothetical protein